jgi:hypothetical protein
VVEEATYEMMMVAPEETASTTNASPTEIPSPSNGNAESKKGEPVNTDAPLALAEETADAPLTHSKKATKYERMKKAFSKKKVKKKHKKSIARRGKKSYFWGQEEIKPDPPSPLGSESLAEKLKKENTRKRKHEREKKKKERSETELQVSSEADSSAAAAGDQVNLFSEHVEEIIDPKSTRQIDLGEASGSGSPGKDEDVETSKDINDASTQLHESAELGYEYMEEMEAGIRNNPEAVVVEESESRRLKEASLGPFRREKILGLRGWVFKSLVVGLVLGTALGAALAVVLSRQTSVRN